MLTASRLLDFMCKDIYLNNNAAVELLVFILKVEF